MRHFDLRSFTLICFTVFAPVAQSADFTQADQLFARRAETSQMIAQARAAYKSAMNGGSNVERVYAIEQIARLNAYEGLKYMDNDPDARIEIFSRCLDDLDLYNVHTAGEAPFFYYWKSVCLAQWARANGIVESLFRTDELFDYLSSGEALDRTYEGGGFARIRGATYAKLPPINPFGPRQDLGKSKQLLESSIASPAYTHSQTPEWDTGDYYFSTYFYLGETLVAMGRRQDAANLLDEAMGRVEAGDFPATREPEERLSYEYMRQLRSTIR